MYLRHVQGAIIIIPLDRQPSEFYNNIPWTLYLYYYGVSSES